MSDKSDKMSDMGAHTTALGTRVSVRLTARLAAKLKKEVSARRTSESTVVREALENYFYQQPAAESCYDAFVRLGLAGLAQGLPRDLSTKKKYFKGMCK